MAFIVDDLINAGVNIYNAVNQTDYFGKTLDQGKQRNLLSAVGLQAQLLAANNARQPAPPIFATPATPARRSGGNTAVIVALAVAGVAGVVLLTGRTT